MALSDEVRRLAKKWQAGTAWPKRLEWLEIHRLRGWTGQRVTFPFPMMAIVGENGSGKSSLLQAAACVYRSDKASTRFATEFFPETAWDKTTDVAVNFGYQQGSEHKNGSIRKPTSRWLGNRDRPIRDVAYIDLSRIQPVAARVGYAKIAKTRHTEASATAFDGSKIQRLSQVMGRTYEGARMAVANIDATREIPVITKAGTNYSGFHQGSGETTLVELLHADLPKNGLVLIDEIESSLHPRAQRRLVRDLAEKCRDREVQIIITTHSPYVLEELPPEARLYIMETAGSPKGVVTGVSPQLAMTKMDDDAHPECDIFVEDDRAKIMLSEILAQHAKETFVRCQIVPFGAANVGLALGTMVSQRRFPRPTCVFLDGDNEAAPGCSVLPGNDAPEIVVFRDLRAKKWGHLWTRLVRDVASVTDACSRAMTLPDHHDWVNDAAKTLFCGGDVLWQAMCAEWAKDLDPAALHPSIVQPIADTLA